MLLDGVHDDRGVVEVLLGQDGQHVDERLAVNVEVSQTGQVLGLDLPGPLVHGGLVQGGSRHDCTLLRGKITELACDRANETLNTERAQLQRRGLATVTQIYFTLYISHTHTL